MQERDEALSEVDQLKGIVDQMDREIEVRLLLTLTPLLVNAVRFDHRAAQAIILFGMHGAWIVVGLTSHACLGLGKKPCVS